MSPQPTLYEIAPGERRDELTVRPVWEQDGDEPLRPGYRHLVALDDTVTGDEGEGGAGGGTGGAAAGGALAGGAHLLAVDAAGKASAFRIAPGDGWFTPVESALDLGRPRDVLRPLVAGGVPHLLAYTAADGQFAFFPLTPDLASRPPALFTRRRGPGPTAGFDTVEPFVVDGLVHYAGYSATSGKVVFYRLDVTATGFEGMAPLRSQVVWEHEWARRWVRFAFFRLGTGTYFLKTNEGRLNVNIDHVLDDPSQGAHEVVRYLDLADALDLDIVRPFTAANGDPYFLTYIADGRTTCNRFRGDARGWTTEARLRTVTGATQAVPLHLGPDRYVLLY
jgi:hypothetical protein